MRSKKTNPFHRLCKSIEASKFLVRAYTTPITTPRNTNGNSRCVLKCASANATALATMDHETGMYFVKEGRRKPRNTISSQIGAHMETTTAYRAIATGSRATIDCSTLESAGRRGTMLMLICDKKFTTGKKRHPRNTSKYQVPLKLK